MRSEMEFNQLYHQQYQPPNEAALVAFLLYEIRCEEFDRHICRVRDEYGNAIPTTQWENKASLRYARHQRKVVHNKLGPDARRRYRAEWRSVAELTYERQRRELERIYLTRQLTNRRQ